MMQSNRDMIYIKGLKVDTIIGIYDWEQRTRQRVVLDINIELDLSHAAKTDDISNTCNYASISEQVTEYIQNSHFQLIETLAEQTAELIFRQFAIPKLSLRVSKPGAVGNADAVGVLIERSRPVP